jgi:hypothetical protein
LHLISKSLKLAKLLIEPSNRFLQTSPTVANLVAIPHKPPPAKMLARIKAQKFPTETAYRKINLPLFNFGRRFYFLYDVLFVQRPTLGIVARSSRASCAPDT